MTATHTLDLHGVIKCFSIEHTPRCSFHEISNYKMNVCLRGGSTFMQGWIYYYWIMPLMSHIPLTHFGWLPCFRFNSTHTFAFIDDLRTQAPLSGWTENTTVVSLCTQKADNLEIRAFTPGSIRMWCEIFLSYIPTTIIPLTLRRTLSTVRVMPEILSTQTLVIKWC